TTEQGARMHAQNWKQPFDEDVAKAKDRHQNAIAEAHEAFKQAEAEAWQQRDAAYRAAEHAWNALKSLPDCPEVAEAREAFQRAKQSNNTEAGHKTAHIAHFKAVRASGRANGIQTSAIADLAALGVDTADWRAGDV